MASKTVIIHPGETIVLPSTTQITAVIQNGAISVVSTCNNLPTPTAQQCYAMEWSVSANAPSNYTLETAEAILHYIKIGGVQYDIELAAAGGGGILTTAFQNVATQLPGAFDFVSLSEAVLANRYDLVLLFRSIPAIASTIEINITGDGYPTNGLFVRPFESEDC